MIELCPERLPDINRSTFQKMNELRNEECSTLWSRFENVSTCTICSLQPHRLSDCDDLLTVNKEQFERASSTL